MSRAGYDDIRIADETMRCSSCSNDIEQDEEYAQDSGGMQICDRCLDDLEDEDAAYAEQAKTVASAITANWDSFDQFADTARIGVASADVEAIEQEIWNRGLKCSTHAAEEALMTICREKVAAESAN